MTQTLQYQIKLIEPLFIPQPDRDMNTARSMNYIPGYIIRNAIIGKWIKNFKSNISADDSNIQDLFFNGSVQYLNAYPYHDNQRYLPIPLSLFHEKNIPGKVYDYTQESAPKLKQPKRFSNHSKFCQIDNINNCLYVVEPQKQLEQHITRDPVIGITQTGGIYKYEVLSSNQEFHGLIRGDKLLLDQISKLLESINRIGGSRSSYGKIEITLLESNQPTESSVDFNINKDELLRLTLLSDGVFRNESGVYTSKLPLNQIAAAKDTFVVENSFIQTGLSGGFNLKWGNWLPQTPTTVMGSVYVLRATKDIPSDTLKAIFENGIGERRSEGFGRVKLNFLSKTEYTISSRNSHDQISNPDDGTSKTIIDRIYLNRIRQQIASTALKVNFEKKEIPNYQLHKIRSVLKECYIKQDLGFLSEFIGSLRTPARKHLESGNCCGESILKFLDNLPQNYQKIFTNQFSSILFNVPTEISDKDKLLIVLELLDQVLDRATARTENGGKKNNGLA